MSNLYIASETAFEIRHQIREPGTQIARCDPDQGPSPSDDIALNVPAFGSDDQTWAEFVSSIRAVGADERRDLLALILMVRGELDLGTWQTAQAQWDEIDRVWAARRESGISLASNYLAEVLVQCGRALARDQDQR